MQRRWGKRKEKKRIEKEERGVFCFLPSFFVPNSYWGNSISSSKLCFSSVLVRITITVQKHMTKETWRKGFWLTLPQQCLSLKEVKTGTLIGQELGGRNWCGGHEGYYLLADSWLLSLLFYRIQDHQPRDVTTHNGLSSPPSITN